MKLSQLLLGLLTPIIFTTSYASNFNFMKDSAMSYFNSKDTALMSANIENALNHTADGKKSTWKNPNTTAWGYAAPSNTTKRNGTLCRNLKIYNEAEKVPGVVNYTFCKIKGRWKIDLSFSYRSNK